MSRRNPLLAYSITVTGQRGNRSFIFIFSPMCRPRMVVVVTQTCLAFEPTRHTKILTAMTPGTIVSALHIRVFVALLACLSYKPVREAGTMWRMHLVNCEGAVYLVRDEVATKMLANRHGHQGTTKCNFRGLLSRSLIVA